MGISWQSPEQRAFFDKHFPSYIRAADEWSLRDSFWPKILDEWLKAWPLSEPPADLVQKEGLEKAEKIMKNKKVDVSTSQRRFT